jgi:hypothetical protein
MKTSRIRATLPTTFFLEHLQRILETMLLDEDNQLFDPFFVYYLPWVPLKRHEVFGVNIDNLQPILGRTIAFL